MLKYNLLLNLAPSYRPKGRDREEETQVYSQEWTCTQVKSKKSFHLILTFIGSTIDAIAAKRLTDIY